MKNKSKTIFLGAIICAVLMISSATAVNISRSEAVKNQTSAEIIEKDKVENNNKEESTGCSLCAEKNIIIENLKEEIKEKITQSEVMPTPFSLLELILIIISAIISVIIWLIMCFGLYSFCLIFNRDFDFCRTILQNCLFPIP